MKMKTPSKRPPRAGGPTHPPVLETARLRLRAHRPDDLTQCSAMWADEIVTRFIGGKLLTQAETWMRILRYAGHWSLLGFGYWVVEEKSTGNFLGEAGLAEFHRDIQPSILGTPEAGWVFTSAAHGNGFASEAMQAVLDWGESHFGCIRTVCLIHPGNAPSLRLAAKLGYKQETLTTFHSHPAFILGRGPQSAKVRS